MDEKKFNKFTENKIEEIYSNIENTNRFILLRGSIGVGKTLIAKELAKRIIDKGNDKDWNEQVSVVPFHPGSDYENVIYGLKLTTANGELKYNATKRILLNAISKAENSDKNYVVILDDVNRGNFAKAMGDVLNAVESKDAGNAIRPGNNNAYKIPDNFYLIATFNPTISNPNIDYAWLRRFMIFDIFSDERYIEDVHKIIERNKCENPSEETEKNNSSKELKKKNFFNETPKEKFTDYIFELYMQIKIMFERYFLDDDVNIIKQYMPGHGLFMTYDDSKSYKENAIKFSYQLKYCIVPLLYQYVKDGLLDKRALADIEAFEHLYDHDFKYWDNKENEDLLKEFTSLENNKLAKIKPVLFTCLKILMGLTGTTVKTIPQSASFRFLLQNVSLVRKIDNKYYFLFDTPEIAKRANDLYIKNSISLGGFIYQIPDKLRLSYKHIKKIENINKISNYSQRYALDTSYQFYNDDNMLVDYIVFRLIKVYLRVKEFDCYVNDDTFKINTRDIENNMKNYLGFFSNKTKHDEEYGYRRKELKNITNIAVSCFNNQSQTQNNLKKP